MEIIVGRKGQQHTPITDLSVSREHCKLTLHTDGTYILENLSINGTFVDGKNIIRSVVTKDTLIRLGSSFTVSVKELLPNIKQITSQQDMTDIKQQEYETQFRKLKAIYDQYSVDKLSIQKETGMNNFYRMLPMTLLSLVGMGTTLIPALVPFHLLLDYLEYVC